MDTVGTIANSLWKVTVIGLIFGAGLPIVFALGIRALDGVPANASGAAARWRPALAAVGYLLIALVAAAVVVGVLYIAKDFLLHTFDVSLFGAQQQAA